MAESRDTLEASISRSDSRDLTRGESWWTGCREGGGDLSDAFSFCLNEADELVNGGALREQRDPPDTPSPHLCSSNENKENLLGAFFYLPIPSFSSILPSIFLPRCSLHLRWSSSPFPLTFSSLPPGILISCKTSFPPLWESADIGGHWLPHSLMNKRWVLACCFIVLYHCERLIFI